MSQVKRRATGIVLAGGASSRMGRDKALLEIGGRQIIDRVVDAVSRVCDEVIIAAGNRPAQIPQMAGLKHVGDPPGAAGPLAGVVAGLRSASHDRCIVVACDMPFLDPALLALLLDGVDGCDAAVPVLGGSSQPLQAAYSSGCLSTAECILRLGGRSMFSLLERLRVRYVSENQCARIDPLSLSLVNVNFPEDFSRARTLYAGMHSTMAVA